MQLNRPDAVSGISKILLNPSSQNLKWNVGKVAREYKRDSYKFDLQSQMETFRKNKVKLASISDKWS